MGCGVGSEMGSGIGSCIGGGMSGGVGSDKGSVGGVDARLACVGVWCAGRLNRVIRLSLCAAICERLMENTLLDWPDKVCALAHTGAYPFGCDLLVSGSFCPNA